MSFDIVLFGATGFVGRLTARHLAAEADPALRIALAGRSLTRLQDVARDLGATASEWPLLVVDATDEAAVTDLAASARVVVTTVGPYVKYGVALAAACAGPARTTATSPVRCSSSTAASPPTHEAAQRTGARIIHACGFDSIPSDLGVWLTARGRPGRRCRSSAAPTSPCAPSRAASAAAPSTRRAPRPGEPETDTVRPPRRRRPVGARGRSGRPPRPSGGTASAPGRGGLGGLVDTVAKASPVKRDADNGHFTGPFVMAAFNSRIVARSASLLGYGDGFRYVEYTDFGSRCARCPDRGGVSVALGAGLAGLRLRPDPGDPRPRPAEARRGPEPRGAQEKGRLNGRHRGGDERRALPDHGRPCRTTRATWRHRRTCSGQAALSLVEDGDDLPDAAGVLTPATALGAPLVERLRAHRFTLETAAPSRLTAAAIFSASMRSSRSIPEIGFV